MSKTPKNAAPSPSPAVETPERDPIAAYEHAVLELFAEGPLAKVSFPGIDAAVLEDAAEATRRAELVVEAAERSLEEARRELHERASALGKLARRAVAYARVLAEDDADLAERLDAIAPRGGEPAKTTRKRKARADEPMLPALTGEEPRESEEEPLAAE